MGEGLTIKLPCGCVSENASMMCPLHGQQIAPGSDVFMRIENTPIGAIGFEKPFFPEPEDFQPYRISVGTMLPIENSFLKDAAASIKLAELGWRWDGKAWVKGSEHGSNA